VEDAEATEVVPSDTARATVVAGQLCADFLGDHQSFVDRVTTTEESPRRLGVVPSVRRSRVGIEGRGVDSATLGDEVLLDEAGAFVLLSFTPTCEVGAADRFGSSFCQ
jgi:hypothetical protein